MKFLANTDVVIIDLRQNGGGSPETVALVTSYLFGPQPVHLNDIYNRPSNARGNAGPCRSFPANASRARRSTS